MRFYQHKVQCALSWIRGKEWATSDDLIAQLRKAQCTKGIIQLVGVIGQRWLKSRQINWRKEKGVLRLKGGERWKMKRDWLTLLTVPSSSVIWSRRQLAVQLAKANWKPTFDELILLKDGERNVTVGPLVIPDTWDNKSLIIFGVVSFFVVEVFAAKMNTSVTGQW